MLFSRVDNDKIYNKSNQRRVFRRLVESNLFNQ